MSESYLQTTRLASGRMPNAVCPANDWIGWLAADDPEGVQPCLRITIQCHPFGRFGAPHRVRTDRAPLLQCHPPDTDHTCPCPPTDGLKTADGAWIGVSFIHLPCPSLILATTAQLEVLESMNLASWEVAPCRLPPAFLPSS